jgi:hypothetical protein
MTYPPFPRNQRGSPFARRATSPSKPTPAMQQKYRGPWMDGASPKPGTAEMIPKSISRTLANPLENFCHAANESRTLRSPSEHAKSFPLPAGTTSTGIPSLTSCPKCRWIVPSPPNSRMASALSAAGIPTRHSTPPSVWRGFRSFGEHPNPRMTAARIGRAESNRVEGRGTAILIVPPAMVARCPDPRAGSPMVTVSPLAKTTGYWHDEAQSTRPGVLAVQFCKGRSVWCCLTLSLMAGCGGSSSMVQDAAPSITTQPSSQSVVVGQTATFSVAATGTTPFSYHWQKGTTAITGATSASYTTPATISAD